MSGGLAEISIISGGLLNLLMSVETFFEPGSWMQETDRALEGRIKAQSLALLAALFTLLDIAGSLESDKSLDSHTSLWSSIICHRFAACGRAPSGPASLR